MVQRMHPNVVVMDIALPELNGIEATRQIMKRNDGAKVLILTMHSDDVCVRQSLKAGARGYLLKDSEDLVRAVKQIARGQSFFSPAAARLLSGDYVTNGGGGKQVEDNLHRLTDRELEVLRLIAEGNTNRHIASLLSVSVNTIETHRKHIMEKLDLHNTADIVRFAVRKKVVH
jgi:two-component system, NarL family, response regulator NreC